MSKLRGLLAIVMVGIGCAACVPLPSWLYEQENEVAIGVARDNIDNGWDDNSVWCYSHSGVFDDQGNEYPTVYSVNSVDLLYYGSCEGILTKGAGATLCQRVGEGWFCTIADDPTITRGMLPLLQTGDGSHK